MSGGVDSSVAAALLQESGHQVSGVTLMFGARDIPDGAQAGHDHQAIAAARATASHLGVAHEVIDARSEFERVVLRPAWEEYSRGRTPNPCALCNPNVKFRLLLDHAAARGADLVATGHHARVAMPGATENHTNGPVLLRGRDPEKDQSYFLFSLSGDQLEHTMLPIGDLTKEQVREKAVALDLPNAERAESQDACLYLPGESFAEALRLVFDDPARPGFFVDSSGRELGRHEGIHLYTIGQRRGLGLALGQRAWVLAIDPEGNRVIVGTREEDLFCRRLEVRSVLWHTTVKTGDALEASVQIRNRHEAAPATVKPGASGSALVEFRSPQRAVTPGQAAVFYAGERVLGGGWIKRACREKQ